MMREKEKKREVLTHPRSSPPTLPHSFPVRDLFAPRSTLVSYISAMSTDFPTLRTLKSCYPTTNSRCVYC